MMAAALQQLTAAQLGSDAFWVGLFASLAPTLTVIAQWRGQNKRLKSTDAKVETVKELVNGRSTALEEKVLALTTEVARLNRERTPTPTAGADVIERHGVVTVQK